MPIDRGQQSVANDIELEEGLVPIGQIVHITTVQFAYRGKLTLVTPSWYVLENVVNVFNTGDLKTYFKTMKGAEEEAWGARHLIERTAVTALWTWK
jgi:hypothetical protein